ncbi:DUF4190 domain-containing protein [Cellulomonas composti]|uniref:Septum formation-related domain-containing protein n=1 Tax=Cellulomonas composti TaxID=266130 RepID=A0A511JEF6_9CELL|nr:DUF4190 domain-containing protein [Cellulomonas composti]GEL96352.1 hypothetical protein CCO02nite_30100 [Cellulomonas composti]
MSTDQPTPTTPADPWAPPDATAAPHQPVPAPPAPAAPAPLYAAAPPPLGTPYTQGYPGAPAGTGYPSAPPVHPYGAVPAPGPYGYPGPLKYDGFAIAGFILSLVGGVLLAVIFGIMGITRTRGGRAKGRGLAIAAVAIGTLWFVAGIVVAVVVAVTTEPTSSYTVGDCVQLSVDGDAQLDDGAAPSLPMVACEVPHNGEVYAARDLPAGPYPGLQRVEQEARAYCTSEFESFVGLPFEDSQLSFFYVYPEQLGWGAGDHEIACVATAVDDVTGTLRGAAR